MSVLGVDACKDGWIAIEWFDDATFSGHYLGTIGDVAHAAPDAEVIAIDIPIGLPTSGPRLADVEARAALGARRSSVFMTPPRAALEATTHSMGSAASKAATGSGMSQQAYALRHKVFEVEAWLPSASACVVEVHPEVSFAEMLGGPASSAKKSWRGMVERYRVLSSVGLYLDEVEGLAAERAAIDDMLDAGAAAWTARRVRDGCARTLPESPPVEEGRRVAIWV